MVKSWSRKYEHIPGMVLLQATWYRTYLVVDTLKSSIPGTTTVLVPC